MPLVFSGVERRSANIFFSVARDGHDVVSQQRGGTSCSKNCSKNRTQSGDTGLRRSSNRESDTFGTSQSPGARRLTLRQIALDQVRLLHLLDLREGGKIAVAQIEAIAPKWERTR